MLTGFCRRGYPFSKGAAAVEILLNCYPCCRATYFLLVQTSQSTTETVSSLTQPTTTNAFPELNRVKNHSPTGHRSIIFPMSFFPNPIYNLDLSLLRFYRPKKKLMPTSTTQVQKCERETACYESENNHKIHTPSIDDGW